MAKQLGHTANYQYFQHRAANYKLHFDPAAGFFRGRNAAGVMASNFDPVHAPNPELAEGNEPGHYIDYRKR